MRKERKPLARVAGVATGLFISNGRALFACLVVKDTPPKRQEKELAVLRGRRRARGRPGGIPA